MKILGQPLCGFRKAVRATARVKMRWEGIQLISNILGTFSNWGVGSAAQIKAIKQAATTQINLEASASIPTWHLEANVPVRSLSSFIEKSWGAAVKGDSKLWPRHADLTLKVSRSLLFSKNFFWATSFLARLPKMIQDVFGDQSARRCSDMFWFHCWPPGLFWQIAGKAGRVHDRRLNSYSASPMCTHQSLILWTSLAPSDLRSKRMSKGHTTCCTINLQSTRHTVVARETAQWTTNFQFWLKSFLDMQETQAPRNCFSTKDTRGDGWAMSAESDGHNGRVRHEWLGESENVTVIGESDTDVINVDNITLQRLTSLHLCFLDLIGSYWI